MRSDVPQLDAEQARILGCLIEKQHTTPAAYPLTLNSLRTACNQSTNRDPVVDYDEQQIFAAVQRLHRMELTRSASGHGSRAAKYRHLVRERLELDDAGEALLAVLLLRGAQTPGELKSRSERLHAFADLTELEAALETLREAGLAEQLEHRPGEKQLRWRELLTTTDEPSAETPLATAEQPAEQTPQGGSEVDQLRAEVAELRDEVAALRALVERR